MCSTDVPFPVYHHPPHNLSLGPTNTHVEQRLDFVLLLYVISIYCIHENHSWGHEKILDERSISVCRSTILNNFCHSGVGGSVPFHSIVEFPFIHWVVGSFSVLLLVNRCWMKSRGNNNNNKYECLVSFVGTCQLLGWHSPYIGNIVFCLNYPLKANKYTDTRECGKTNLLSEIDENYYLSIFPSTLPLPNNLTPTYHLG